MRNLPGNIIRLLFILVAGYAVARVGLHYYVKDQLKNLTNDLAAYVTVSYDTLKTDIDGTIDVSGIKIIPLGENQSINIANMHVVGPDALELLLSKLPVIGSGGPPAFARIAFNNINLPLTGSLGDKLDQAMLSDGAKKIDECGVSGLTSIAMARSLGMQELRADSDARYRFDAGAQTLSANISLDVKGIQSVAMNVVLTNVSSAALSEGSNQIPSIKKLDLSFEIPAEYGARVSKYCAAKHQLSEADYKLLLVDQFVRQQRALGVELGWGLQTAAKLFYRDWGKVEISFNPDSPINPMGLVLLKPELILEKVGAELTVNGTLITDLGLTVGKTRGTVSNYLVPEKKVYKPRPPRPVYESVYRQVSVSSLPRYINQPVKMTMRDGPVRSGVLAGTSGDQAVLDQRKNGGMFTSHINLVDVVRVEALIKVQVNKPSVPPKTEGEQADSSEGEQAGSDDQGQAGATESGDQGAADQK